MTTIEKISFGKFDLISQILVHQNILEATTHRVIKMKFQPWSKIRKSVIFQRSTITFRLLLKLLMHTYIFYRCYHAETFPELVVSADRRAEHCNNFGIDSSDSSACCNEKDFCNELITFKLPG